MTKTMYFILCVLLSCIIESAFLEGQIPNAPIQYVVLNKNLPKDVSDIFGAGYAISVSRKLNVDEMKQIICRFVHDEVHMKYLGLAVDVYENLESKDYSPGSLPDLAAGQEYPTQRIQDKKYLGAYFWSNKTTGESGELSYGRAESFKSYAFNHVKDCPSPPK